MIHTFCNCQFDGEHEFHCTMMRNNRPRSTVRATVYRNAFVGDIEVTKDAEVTLDRYGIHGWWIVDGVKEPLSRLNSQLGYSFDAPDSLCPIRAKRNYIRQDGSVVFPNWPYDEYKVEE